MLTNIVKHDEVSMSELVADSAKRIREHFGLSKKYRIINTDNEPHYHYQDLLELQEVCEHFSIKLFDAVDDSKEYGYFLAADRQKKKGTTTHIFEKEIKIFHGYLKLTYKNSDFYSFSTIKQSPPHGEEINYKLLVNEDEIDTFYEFYIEFSEFTRKKRSTTKYITVFGGYDYSVENLSYKWDDLIFEKSIKESIRESIDFWYNNETWYRDRKFPYKRGILLHGYPGNGKTFLTKVIISQYDLSIVQFNFGNPELGNDELSDAFRYAVENAPSLFLLEDIDRVFSNYEKDITCVTKDALFNCLDGIEELDGVLIVATANHPEDMDSALINRPSRFDTIIQLNNPTCDLRLEYLTKLFNNEAIENSILIDIAEQCDGMSMAFMKEIYFKSVINSLKDKDKKIKTEHIYDALKQCMNHFGIAMTAKSERTAGFMQSNDKSITAKKEKKKILAGFVA